MLRSRLAYKCLCVSVCVVVGGGELGERRECNANSYNETKSHFKFRLYEHFPISYFTSKNMKINNIKITTIQKHQLCCSPFFEVFPILTTSSSKKHLREEQWSFWEILSVFKGKFPRLHSSQKFSLNNALWFSSNNSNYFQNFFSELAENLVKKVTKRSN